MSDNTFREINVPLADGPIRVVVTGKPDYRQGDEVRLRHLHVDDVFRIVQVTKRRRTTELILAPASGKAKS